MKLKRWMCLLAVLFMFAAVPAQADTVSSALHSNAETAEEQTQFPFLAETNELAVNVRKETSTKSASVGRLERGMRLSVVSEQINASGERWYAVELEDGTKGYIRSDLLIGADEAEAERANMDAEAQAYIGNRKTKKFHRTDCRTLPAPKNHVTLSSREKAISSGYVPCKNCDP